MLHRHLTHDPQLSVLRSVGDGYRMGMQGGDRKSGRAGESASSGGTERGHGVSIVIIYTLSLHRAVWLPDALRLSEV
jgi:hypothetical protein